MGSVAARRVSASVGDLQGLIVIGILMTSARREEEVVRLTLSTVPALVRCDLVALILRDAGAWRVEGRLDGESIPPLLRGQLCQWTPHRINAFGSINRRLNEFAWTSVHPLRSCGELIGYLVVASRTTCERSERATLLLQGLAIQTAAGLANARMHEDECRRHTELRSLTQRLEAALDRSARILAIHERLNAAASEAPGITGIAAGLSELTGVPVVIEDNAANILAIAGALTDPRSLSPGDLSELRRRVTWSYTALNVRSMLVQPVRSKTELLASIWLTMDPTESPDDLTLVALEYAATVLALDLSHERRLAETELRLRRDFTEELLQGMLEQDPRVQIRARALGVDLLSPARVAVVRSQKPESLGRLLERLRGSGVKLATLKDGQLALVAPATIDWHSLRSLLCHGLCGCDIAIGVGSVCQQLRDYPQSYREAIRAVRLLPVAQGGIMRFDDLGVLKVLLTNDDPTLLNEFTEEWLSPLLRYDEAHHSDLVNTLATYLDCGGNQVACANALSIHVSTLKYRLQRIRDVSGHDLRDPDACFHLQLATRARRALGVLLSTQRGASG